MANVMLALEIIGIVTVVGLMFTSENRNAGVSRFFAAAGHGINTFTAGAGPGA